MGRISLGENTGYSFQQEFHNTAQTFQSLMIPLHLKEMSSLLSNSMQINYLMGWNQTQGTLQLSRSQMMMVKCFETLILLWNFNDRDTCAEVRVSFDADSYQVSENEGSVSVCVTTEDIIAQGFSIAVATQDLQANGTLIMCVS